MGRSREGYKQLLLQKKQEEKRITLPGGGCYSGHLLEESEKLFAWEEENGKTRIATTGETEEREKRLSMQKTQRRKKYDLKV